MNKVIIIICTIILLCSCSSKRKDLYGTYVNRDFSTLTRFDINQDGTFYYLTSGGMIAFECYGNWKLVDKGRKVYLKSYIEDINNIPIRVSTDKNKYDGTIIVFNKPMKSFEESYSEFINRKYDRHDTLYYSLVINDTLEYRIYTDSVFLPKAIIVNSFYVKMNENFDGLLIQPIQDTAQTKKHTLEDRYPNLYVINFDFPQLKESKLFYNENINDTLLIRGESLYWYKNNYKIRINKIDNIDDSGK